MARQRAEVDALAYQALLVAGLRRVPGNKRLPSLKSLIGDDKPRSLPSAEEVASNARAWGMVLAAQAG